MCKGLFSNSNRTNSVQKDTALRPIVFKINANDALNKVYKILLEYNFETLIQKTDYHEIFGRKNKFEYTFTFVEDFGKSYLTILIYSEKKTFSTRKYLKDIACFIRDKMSLYIY